MDFKNTVVIMTSNVAGGLEGVQATFKPEFVNRLDEIVEFHQLTREEIGRIVELQVASARRARARAGVEIELTEDARTLLGNLGYDPTYGARPLKRVIQKRLVDRLALKLLEGEFAPGRPRAGGRRRRRAGVRDGRRREPVAAAGLAALDGPALRRRAATPASAAEPAAPRPTTAREDGSITLRDELSRGHAAQARRPGRAPGGERRGPLAAARGVPVRAAGACAGRSPGCRSRARRSCSGRFRLAGADERRAVTRALEEHLRERHPEVEL